MERRVRALLVSIEENLHRPFSVTELAESVRLSPSRIRQLVKEETGAPLMTYVRNLRMARAKELLETSFLSVKEIAAKVGIGDLSHFAKSFYKTYHVRPGQYRARDCSAMPASSARVARHRQDRR